MTSDQTKKVLSILKDLGIKRYEFDTDLGTHYYNDGERNIATYSEEMDMIVNVRATYGYGTKTYDEPIMVFMSDPGDIHEFRFGGDPEVVKKFLEASGLTLSKEDLQVIVNIDRNNVTIKPMTGDYVNGFTELTEKQLEKLSPEERKEYEEKLAEYKGRKLSEGLTQGAAAQITL